MDERALSELLECSVCLESLDATSKVLPCQHTFCKRCLEEIVCTKRELRCPECRTLVNISVDDLPTNILLIRLLEGMKTAKAGVSGSSSDAGSPGSSGKKSSATSPTNSKSGASPAAAAKAASPYKAVNIAVPCAKALYSYEAKEPGDLSFKKGDVITLRKQVDENWYHGELGNKHGFFPATYVQVITPLPQEIPTCKALYDFVITDKNEKDCLTFQKDEMVTVIRRIDNNWAEGKLGERIGIFPISFVEMNDSAKWLINTQANQARNSSNSNNHVNQSHSSNGNNTKTPTPVTMSPTSTTATTAPSPADSSDTSPTATTSGINPLVNPGLLAAKYLGQKRHSLTSIGQKLSLAVQQHHRHSVELSGTNGLTTTIAPVSSTAVTPAITQSLMSSPAATSSTTMMSQSMIERSPDSPLSTATSAPAIYVALYNYKPVKDDEVELKKSDYYMVSEKCQDGWFKGTCLRTGTSGVFPGNYVQVVKLGSKSGGNRTVLGTSGQQHLHQQHLQQQAAAAAVAASGATSSQLASPIAAKSHHHHISVSRAHSFPKTSPLAMSNDYQARTGGQGVSGRTNVTTSQGRSTNSNSSASSAAAASSHSQKVSSGASHSSQSSSKSSRGTSSSSAPSSASPSSLVQAQEKAGRRSPSHSHSHSPRSSRKSTADRVVKHAAAMSGLSDSRSAAAVAAPPVTVRSSSQKVAQTQVNSSSPHSMLTTTATITPPNKVVGATVDELLPVGAVSQLPSHRDREYERRDKDKEKKEKKEKDRLSIVKRLTKSKKSKSPPPDTEASASGEASSGHHRTGSLPSTDLVAGAIAAAAKVPPPLPHRKTSSMDATSKTPRTKPFLRERYRCIVPYPPQSDLEIELKLGDIVYVHKKRDDCWYKGTLQRTGKTGLFPASFVEKF